MDEPFAPAQLLRFHLDHLRNVLLPFWRERAMDETYGGYFTCFENSGERLLSTDKFTWSQGRMVWVLAALATLPHLPLAERNTCAGPRRGRISCSGIAFCPTGIVPFC